MGLIYTLNRVKPNKVKIIDLETKEEITIQIYVCENNRTGSTQRRMSIEASQRFKIEKVRDGD